MSHIEMKYFVDILIGLVWGDEGKGKVLVDLLQGRLGTQYVACVRYNGGCNAGHSVWIRGNKYVTHQVPTGILVPGISNLIAKGVKVDLVKLVEEIKGLRSLGVDVDRRIYLDPEAHIVCPTHILLDGRSEDVAGKEKIGSTRNGMGPIAMSKMARESVRLNDLLRDNGNLERLVEKHKRLIALLYKPLSDEELAWLDEAVVALKGAVRSIQDYVKLADSHIFIMEQLQKGNVLAEGAQGFLLDVDHGTYKDVTSSNSGVGAFIDGTEAPWYTVGRVFGVTKMWYVTRVGNGPFPTELCPERNGYYVQEDGLAWTIQQAGEREEGSERGASTGRPRRVGLQDLQALNWAARVVGITDLILTKADRPGPLGTDSIKVSFGYGLDGIPLLPSHNPVPYMDRVKPVYKQVAFVPAVRDRDYRSQPEAVRNMVELLRNAVWGKVRIPFISVGPEPGQIVYVDHPLNSLGTLLEIGSECTTGK